MGVSQHMKIVGSYEDTFTISDSGDTLRYVLVEGIAAADIEDSSWYVDTILGDSIAYVTPAKIIKITPTALMDSFNYYDSVDGTIDAGVDTILYTSPMYRMRLTPTLDTSRTYIFKVIWASGDTMGFDFDCGSAGTVPTTVAILIDSLMDSITAYTDLTDSMEFHDSVSYIRMTALYATETHGGRWVVQSDGPIDPTMTLRSSGRIVQTPDPLNVTVAIICDTFTTMHNGRTTTGDSILATDYGTYFTLSTKHGSQANTLDLPNDWSVTMYGESGSGEDADSAWDTTTTQAATIKSVIDGLCAAINATVTVKDTVEAVNTGDTAYYLIARRHKQDFANKPDDRFTDPDTVDDATSVSTTTDSFPIGTSNGGNALQGRIIVGDMIGYTASKLTGLEDSAIVWLLASGPTGSWAVDSQISASLPCTLDVLVGEQDGDSLLSEHLWVKWYVMDSITDTSGVTVAVPVTYNLFIK